ncbi:MULTISPECIES: HisA/HisF-related TIM barrel protein [Methylosinus]|nr:MULTISPECIES: HisA/HisF-related TIM barrel protein [Methylosinus]OBS53210.1 histidine biosynthesis protein [Methylosinus sp. 3S-1]
MQIIPVIDLKGGRVVRAVRGERADYAPIVSPLAASSAARDVVAGFFRLFDFPILYVADLDAIEGRPGHGETLAALAHAFPQIALWVDDGSADANRIAALCAAGVRPVIGSESLPAGDAPRIDAEAVLSLDFRGGRFLGPPALLDDVRLWPRDVIAMTLARVGSFEGPDVELISRLSRVAEGRRLFAAGGVRDAYDLDRLAEAGAAGALVASALHDGRLSVADLRRFAGL